MRLWSTGEAYLLERPVMGRLTTTPRARELRAGYIPYIDSESATAFSQDWDGYEAILSRATDRAALPIRGISGPRNLEYLADEDVVHLHPDGTVQVLYRQ